MIHEKGFFSVSACVLRVFFLRSAILAGSFALSLTTEEDR